MPICQTARCYRVLRERCALWQPNGCGKSGNHWQGRATGCRNHRAAGCGCYVEMLTSHRQWNTLAPPDVSAKVALLMLQPVTLPPPQLQYLKKPGTFCFWIMPSKQVSCPRAATFVLQRFLVMLHPLYPAIEYIGGGNLTMLAREIRFPA